MNMKTKPLVSVVTPSFNQGAYVEETIKSVLSQDYPNVEYGVIDGGSTDATGQVLQTYRQHLSYCVSEPDRGQTHAINKGWGRAQGDILAFLNSDDLYMPGAVSAAVQYLEAHPNCDLAFGHAWLTDQERQKYWTSPATMKRVTPARLTEYSCIIQPTVFMRRSLVERIGSLDETLHFAFDYDYWLRAMDAGAQFGHMRAYTAVVRIHASAKSVSQRESLLREEMAIFRRLLSTTQQPDRLRSLYGRALQRRALLVGGATSPFEESVRHEARHLVSDGRFTLSPLSIAGVIDEHDREMRSQDRYRREGNAKRCFPEPVVDSWGSLDMLEAVHSISRATRRRLRANLEASDRIDAAAILLGDRNNQAAVRALGQAFLAWPPAVIRPKFLRRALKATGLGRAIVGPYWRVRLAASGAGVLSGRDQSGKS
jgi:GT2 family glycosyltransferase